MKIKRIFNVVLVASTLVLLALPSIALADDGPTGDRVVFGGSYHLGKNETLNGSLVVIGGTATMEEGATITEDIVVVGGSLSVNGRVLGDLVAVGGLLNLGEKSVINGDLVRIGVSLSQQPGAQVQGEVIEGKNNPFTFTMPTFSFTPAQLYSMIVTDMTEFLFRTLALAALAVVLMLIAARPTERVANSITAQPFLSFGVGILTLFILPIILIILTVTIILIPISLLGVIAIALALLLGWVGMGLEIGNRMGDLFKVEWQPAIAVGVGTFTLTFISGAFSYIPCIGWLVPMFFATIGLGSVILTRAGSRNYPTDSQPAPRPTPPAPTMPAPPTPPVPPAPPRMVAEVQPETQSDKSPTDEKRPKRRTKKNNPDIPE